MTGRELAVLLGPMIGIGARDRLRALATEAVNDIALRYDELRDCDGVMQLLLDRVDDLQFIDGEEWFIIELEGTI